MATARTHSLRLVEPEAPNPFDASVEIDLTPETPAPEAQDGAAVTQNADGSVTVDFSPQTKSAENLAFDANLADHIDADRLAQIAEQLLQGIQADDQSRSEWLATRARGITLLGLQLEEPRSDVNTTAPLEGMSTIRHPALLEATIRFQATARSELLPASGPVKVRNDTPVPPPVAPPALPTIGHNGGPPLEEAGPAPAAPPTGAAPPAQSPVAAPAPFAPPEAAAGAPPMAAPAPPAAPPPPAAPAIKESGDDLAAALEKDFNHYLTVTATEYVPDTDRMLFYVGFGGDGFKKVFNCPLRRRPVSESVDADDLIVANASTDLKNCIRVTHRIKMRPALVRRMQIIGAYRDVTLQQPNIATTINPVEEKKADIQGVPARPTRPEDGSYIVFECYCELDIDEFAPEQFKGKSLPLPYIVTIEEQSRQILQIRRNWKEDDAMCLARHRFVQFPFIRGLGFYGIGYVHILGNLTIALTAAYRLMLDNGMFANFPGMLGAKGAGRQSSNQIRVPPGGVALFDIGTLDDIRKAFMALPYKETGPSFATFIAHVEEVVQRLSQTANIMVGEGKQDAPVGTTLALIEQATKMIDSVHKRLHAAQAEEFGLLADCFREDPEAFWRHNKRPAKPWQKEQFLKALDTYGLVPVADPNNPTSLHRIAKAAGLKELQKASPTLYDPYKVDRKVMTIVGLDAEDTMNPVPANPQPDPRFEAIKQKSAQQERMAQVQEKLATIKAATAHDQLVDRAADRQSREQIEILRLIKEVMDTRQSEIIHANDAQQQGDRKQADAVMSLIEAILSMHMKQEQHDQRMEHGQQMHEARLQQAKKPRKSAREKTDA